jgi:predicted ribosome quality control (RQC) complex YloA/Tae2 family protein
MANGITNRHPNRTASRSRFRKEKQTFSLSREALDYLNSLAKRYSSRSEALEALICRHKEHQERKKISAGIRDYYDSISEEERAENRAWGDFVVANLGKG